MTHTRRTVIKSAAWSLPVIAAAIAVPLAAASTVPTPRKPLLCTKEPNHGHGGGKGNAWWRVIYDDGTAEILDNGTVMSTRELKEVCKP